jgi:hypothetical protein
MGRQRRRALRVLVPQRLRVDRSGPGSCPCGVAAVKEWRDPPPSGIRNQTIPAPGRMPPVPARQRDERVERNARAKRGQDERPAERESEEHPEQDSCDDHGLRTAPVPRRQHPLAEPRPARRGVGRPGEHAAVLRCEQLRAVERRRWRVAAGRSGADPKHVGCCARFAGRPVRPATRGRTKRTRWAAGCWTERPGAAAVSRIRSPASGEPQPPAAHGHAAAAVRVHPCRPAHARSRESPHGDGPRDRRAES